MPTSYACANPARMSILRDTANGPNAIDHLVVEDGGEGSTVPPVLRQRVLLVRTVRPFAAGVLDPNRVRVVGGVRVLDPEVTLAVRLREVKSVYTGTELVYLDELLFDLRDELDEWLFVLLDRYGDHSRYRLRLGTDTGPPAGFDPVLSEIEFSFKVDCPAPFDCLVDDDPDPPPAAEPELDYLARDFPSFRRLMLDRLAALDPAGVSDDPAELRTVVVEALAYATDQLAYFQDAVATEAYLGTARTRPSVRRHARLLDYPMHEGCTARAFVHLQVRDGIALAGSDLPTSATFLSRLPGEGAVVPRGRPLPATPEVFEALAWPSAVRATHNAIAFHTWGDQDCSLPVGAVEAAVVDTGLALVPGDALVLEEIRSVTDEGAEPDPARRHAVRLVAVGDPVPDPLFPGTSVRLLRWHERDALPFAMRIDVGGVPIALARGNLVLADHGRTITAEPLAIERWGQGLRARLAEPLVAWAAPVAGGAPVADTLGQDPAAARPLVRLRGEDEDWEPVRDLLDTPSSGRAFVVEPESDGKACLRFGDGTLGRRPVDLTSFTATYRVGGPTAGNVGADGIRHLLADGTSTAAAALAAAVTGVRNPLPARGGRAPERIDEVRMYAPQAFRVQQRAVTEADWVEVTQRHPHVQRAIASRRWTGSWHTVYITADPIAGVRADELRDELAVELERYRLAGYDLEVREPRYVPLDIVLTVCVRAGAFREDVARALRREFSVRVLPDGRRGFFHPDEFTFGDTVWLSAIVARAMAVPGVDRVDAAADGTRFTRRGTPQGTEIDDARILVGALEIARCDSDPAAPDNGRIDFVVEGGT